MTRHRFVNDGISPIPMGATAEYACTCGRRGSREAIAQHVADQEVDNAFDDGGGTEAYYLPVEPRAPAFHTDARESFDSDALTPIEPLPVLPDVELPSSLRADCPICRRGALMADLLEIAAWSCGHWIRKKSQPIAESFQDMLRAAFQAGVTAATSRETFETWYQREVLR